jgi:TonB family protein
MMNVKLHQLHARSLSVATAAIAVFFAGASLTRAQQAEMRVLVAPLAKEISHSHKHKLAILPLLTSDTQNLQLGVWLAKELSAILSSMVSGLELIDASDSHVAIRAAEEPGYPVYDPEAVEEFVKNTGAEIVVTGSFMPFGQSLGMSLSASKRGERQILAQNNGQIPSSPEVSRLVPQSLRFEAPTDGIYHAGWGGVGVPKCRSCPDPSFPRDEASKRREGTVVLNAVIGIDGRAHQIEIKKGTSESFGASALQAVRRWTFQPATGPDGKPLMVRIPIEVTFRM